jgi:hypothetical protein
MMGTYITIPRVFEMFNLTERKRDCSDPLNAERGSIHGYRDARARAGGGPKLGLI